MSDVPRTLHLLARRHGGGTETNVNRLCRAVDRFDLLALEEIIGRGLSLWRLPAAVREIRRRNPDVIFCYGITAHVAAQLAFPWGKPLVGNIRCETDFVGIKGLWKKIFARRFFPWVSNSKKALQGEGGVIIYNGITDPPPEIPLLENLTHPVMGILASGHAKKGHRFALELWKGMGKRGTLVFAGSLSEELKEEAEREGVVCTGFVQAGPLLRSLDLLLVPSTAEGTPTVLLEAMVRGIPTLSTPVGGIPELIEHERTGFLLEREDWRNYLERMDWGMANVVGEAGREHVLRNHSFERMKRQFIEAAKTAVR